VTDADPELAARNLSAESLAADDPTGWFERLYSAAADGEAVVPWDRGEPRELLVEWAEQRGLRGDGRRAVVVGAGFGADAEYVASLGFATTAFDISATAVRLARERHPRTHVDYVAADLLDPPAGWLGAFDLVVEVITVQSLPDPPRAQAIANVARLVTAGGTLIVISAAREEDEPANGPPWPLTRAEIDAFAAAVPDLEPVRVERLSDTMPRWRAEFHRGGPADVARAFAAAVNGRDLDAALALWSDEALIVSPDGVPTRDVAAAVAALIENGVTLAIEVEHTYVAGDVATATGTLTMGNSASSFTAVYGRDGDGRWRIAIDAPWGLPATVRPAIS
jgi:SAM-dependent methyltransferase